MITAIDHIVMTAADVEATIRFCVMRHWNFRVSASRWHPARKALLFGAQKINLHDAAAPYVPHARQPVAGALDLCFLGDMPIADWQAAGGHDIPIECGR